jgi:nucleoside-diphosphate-sugar epimerase
MAETVLLNAHGDIPLVILRLSGIYDENCHSIPLSQHIRRIYEKDLESYFFPGEKDHGQPYLHMEDLAECMSKTMERADRLESTEIILIAEPEVMSQEDLQEELGMLIHGKEWPTYRIPKPIAKMGAWAQDQLSSGESFIKPWMIDLADDHYAVELSKAREKLGWKPKHRLRNTLPEIVRRLKADPEGWYEVNGLRIPEESSSKKK